MSDIKTNYTKNYQDIINSTQEQTKSLNKVLHWTQTYDNSLLSKNSSKINEIFIEALERRAAIQQQLSQIDFGSDYAKAKKENLSNIVAEDYSKMLIEISQADALLGKVTATLDHLSHQSGVSDEEQLRFNPVTPWFYERWAEAVSSAALTVLAPVTTPAKFVIQHPYATLAGGTALMAAASYMICDPENFPFVEHPALQQVLPKEIQTCDLSTQAFCITSSVVSLGISILGLKEPVEKQIAVMQKGIEFACDNPGTALYNTAKALVWDIPKGAAELTASAASAVLQTAKYGHLIGPAIGAATYALGSDPFTATIIASGGLVAKTLHAEFGPQSVVLE